MNTILKMNALNQLKKGDRISSTGIIVKGTVCMHRGRISRIAQKGSIIGIFNIFAKEYPTEWIVMEDTFFYSFSIKDEKSLEDFFKSNPDYRGIAVYSMAKELAGIFEEREGIRQTALEIRDFMNQDMEGFLEEALQLDCSEEKLSNYLEYANVSLEITKNIIIIV